MGRAARERVRQRKPKGSTIMKTILCIIILTCFSCSWSKAEITKEVCYGVLHALEIEQTVYGIEKLGYKESNPMYGEHPSKGKIRTIGLVTGAGHYLITNYIWPEYRASWQNITLGFKVAGTGWNLCVILRR
jgi:hypothetical protein